MECFERALELTSVNCGFCRKRIVGLARKKQYKVDNTLWNEILAKCPFIGTAMISDTTGGIAIAEPSWTIEFIDEQAAPRQASQAESQELKPGELKQIYEQRVREHQSQLEQEEALALEKTMDFLQSDPEYLASVARHDNQPAPVVSTTVPPTANHQAQEGRIKSLQRAAPHSDKSSAPPVQTATSRHVLLSVNGVARQCCDNTRINSFSVTFETSEQTVKTGPQPRLRASSQRLAQSPKTQARGDPDNFVPAAIIVVIIIVSQHSARRHLHFENHSIRETEIIANRILKACRETESSNAVEVHAVYFREHVF